MRLSVADMETNLRGLCWNDQRGKGSMGRSGRHRNGDRGRRVPDRGRA